MDRQLKLSASGRTECLVNPSVKETRAERFTVAEGELLKWAGVDPAVKSV